MVNRRAPARILDKSLARVYVMCSQLVHGAARKKESLTSTMGSTEYLETVAGG